MRRLIALAILGIFFLGTGSTQAATVNSSIALSVNVLPSCTVSSSAVAFGDYTPLTSASRQGTLTVNCSSGTIYAVALNEGGAGDGTSRHMVRADGATIAYDLYSDSAHTQRWGSGANSQAGTGSGADKTMTVYAAIPPSAAPAGNYSDNVTVMVSY